MRRRGYREAERHGRNAERLCMLMLRLKAYRILAHHWRCPAGELDIVARRGRTLAVIEVKARFDYASAAEAVSTRQQGRIAMAARLFIAARPNLATLDVRFDVMLVVPCRLPRHLEAAWLET